MTSLLQGLTESLLNVIAEEIFIMYPPHTRHFPSNCRYVGEANWHPHPSGLRQETSGNVYKAVCRKQSRSRTLRRIWVGLDGMVRKRLPEEMTSEQRFSWIKWESQAGICGEQLLDTANHTCPVSAGRCLQGNQGVRSGRWGLGSAGLEEEWDTTEVKCELYIQCYVF